VNRAGRQAGRQTTTSRIAELKAQKGSCRTGKNGDAQDCFGPVADIPRSSHSLPVTEPEPTQSSFVQRHPVVVMILLVFGVGLLSGAFLGRPGNVLGSAFFGGMAGTVLFLMICSVPALVITVFQSIRRASVQSFGRRFMSNVKHTMEIVILGWS
jgi:hypothetical protein